MAEFDPAAAFLLTMPWHNLFEPASGLPTITDVRCKGCREILPLGGREKHFNAHRAASRRAELARQKKIRREAAARLANARKRRAVVA